MNGGRVFRKAALSQLVRTGGSDSTESMLPDYRLRPRATLDDGEQGVAALIVRASPVIKLMSAATRGQCLSQSGIGGSVSSDCERAIDGRALATRSLRSMTGYQFDAEMSPLLPHVVE